MTILAKRVKVVDNDVPSLNRFKKGDTGLVVKVEAHARGGYDHTVQLDKLVNPITFQREELEVIDDVK